MATTAEALFEKLAALKRDWPGNPWEWDGRFEAAASSFGIALEPKAREATALALPQSWTSKSVAEAPPALKAVCMRAGGLRPGQLLFGGETVGGVTPYGLWWPWGGGGTVTLRLALDGTGAPVAELRKLFGV